MSLLGFYCLPCRFYFSAVPLSFWRSRSPLGPCATIYSMVFCGGLLLLGVCAFWRLWGSVLHTRRVLRSNYFFLIRSNLPLRLKPFWGSASLFLLLPPFSTPPGPILSGVDSLPQLPAQMVWLRVGHPHLPVLRTDHGLLISLCPVAASTALKSTHK